MMRLLVFISLTIVVAYIALYDNIAISAARIIEQQTAELERAVMLNRQMVEELRAHSDPRVLLQQTHDQLQHELDMFKLRTFLALLVGGGLGALVYMSVLIRALYARFWGKDVQAHYAATQAAYEAAKERRAAFDRVTEINGRPTHIPEMEKL